MSAVLIRSLSEVLQEMEALNYADAVRLGAALKRGMNLYSSADEYQSFALLLASFRAAIKEKQLGKPGVLGDWPVPLDEVEGEGVELLVVSQDPEDAA